MSSKSAIAALAIGVMATMPALAGHGHDYRSGRLIDLGYDDAQVIDVEPLVRQVRVIVPRQECYAETHYVPVGGHRYADQPAAGPMILGGLVGAVIGHQIGHRASRNVGTIAGAVIGSAIGHDAAQRRLGRLADYEPEELRAVESQRCEVREEERVEQQIDGYRVTYRYNGRNYVTQLPYDPGERIRVRVDVDPVG